MINKKFLVSAALAGMLLSGSTANAQVGVQDVEELDVFYARAAYTPAMLQELSWAGGKAETPIAPKYKPGFISGAGALGYYFGGMRVEIEGSMQTVGVFGGTGKEKLSLGTGGDKDTTYKGATFMGGMLSVNYDIAVSDYISPYFGVGFGVQRVSLDFEKGASSAFHIASQLKAGVNVTGLASVVPYAGYKITYLNEQEYEVTADDGSTTVKPKIAHMSHNLEVGVMIPMNA